MTLIQKPILIIRIFSVDMVKRVCISILLSRAVFEQALAASD